MKKKIFFGLTLFAILFTLVAWQYASAELVELENTPELSEQNSTEAV